ncbi:MAG: PaaI family thioesterase [Thermaerobacter sp.]|nr:PaaI family thioesterase [Thermaerobacter sp.]
MSGPGSGENCCWVCGPDHPEGLHVEWHLGHPVTAQLVVPARYQGFTGVAHGGTIAAILDDGMWHAVWQETEGDAATVELTVRYRHPVMVGVPLVVEGWAWRSAHRVVAARATLARVDGRVMADARARFLPGASVHRAIRPASP